MHGINQGNARNCALGQVDRQPGVAVAIRSIMSEALMKKIVRPAKSAIAPESPALYSSILENGVGVKWTVENRRAKLTHSVHAAEEVAA